MINRRYQILFKGIGEPIPHQEITKNINNFGKGYNAAVREIILNSEKLTEKTFKVNVARILNNFLMARSGPFKGVKRFDGKEVTDPHGNIDRCWEVSKEELVAIKKIFEQQACSPRSRTLVMQNPNSVNEVVNLLWVAFKKLLPVTMGKNSYGLVGASKILFSVFPEIVLPIDNSEWLHVFKTIDLGDVIHLMRDEIITWEKATGMQLQDCDNDTPQLTLPGVYNVMAMQARP
ncbi:MAG: hypothetical protein ACYDBT_09810 [Desulfobulbaceae bacterium]